MTAVWHQKLSMGAKMLKQIQLTSFLLWLSLLCSSIVLMTGSLPPLLVHTSRASLYINFPLNGIAQYIRPSDFLYGVVGQSNAEKKTKLKKKVANIKKYYLLLQS